MKTTNFDWARLTHVRGSAAGVPELLEQLTSADDDTSAAALEKLIDLLFHQNDVTEATAAFVLASETELLSPVGERRCEAFFDLFALFAAAAQHFAPHDDARGEAALAQLLRSEPIVGRLGSMNTRQAADAQWAALRRAVPWTEPYLALRDESAAWAARFLAAMGSAASSIHPAIRVAFEKASRERWEPETRGLLAAAVGATGDDSVEPFLRDALADRDFEVRGAAATELLNRSGSACADEVISVLAELGDDDVPDYFALQSLDEIYDRLDDRAAELRERLEE